MAKHQITLMIEALLKEKDALLKENQELRMTIKNMKSEQLALMHKVQELEGRVKEQEKIEQYQNEVEECRKVIATLQSSKGMGKLSSAFIEELRREYERSVPEVDFTEDIQKNIEHLDKLYTALETGDITIEEFQKKLRI